MNIDKIEYRASKKTVKVGKTKTTSKVTQVVIFVRKNKVWQTATEAGLVDNSTAPETMKNIKLYEVFEAAGLEVPQSVKDAAEKELRAYEDKELTKKYKREAEYLKGHDIYMNDEKTKAELAAERRWTRLEAEFKEEFKKGLKGE
jgi:hypothetical protein